MSVNPNWQTEFQTAKWKSN